MTIIVNLTQHAGTPEQGVVEPASKGVVAQLLTFEEIPTKEEMMSRAQALAIIAKDAGAEAAMIGGAPFFMAPLEAALMKEGITPLYAFSRRESVEEKLPNGDVLKKAVFRHLGFVKGVTWASYAQEYNQQGGYIGFRYTTCLEWDRGTF